MTTVRVVRVEMHDKNAAHNNAESASGVKLPDENKADRRH